MAVADVDRNGFNDLIIGGDYDGVHLVSQSATGFSAIALTGPKIMMQAANLVDINKDGWVDYFACNDLGINQIWGNNKEGSLLPVSDWIDLATVPASNNSGNYGSVWSDIDNDGDLDLYIAKCSIFAMGYPQDPRRINMLFINDGKGHFSEHAADCGLRINGQSWTADFADIDNDGDMDCFVTNHESNSMLLENDGTGHFTDITPTTGIGSLGHPLQALLRDFDNDGYVDLLVSGSESHLYHSNGNKTFSEVTSAFGGKTLKSFAVGDLNHDGFQDVYVSYHDYQATSAGVGADELWLNQPNGNHYLAITLKGVQSNLNGIGARITIYTDNQKQIREVRSGESYGIMNSLTQYVGLGNYSRIDRLEVAWPSGQRTVLQGVTADQFLTIEEPNCKAGSCVPLTILQIR
ncbi:CRTAC1 family protein [Spirosoma panaciterrae]|uniref:CRTAC1 family protein n=1 Tax=Spirosoma panaciterrae TaxID=496058 RepID=UPI001FE13A75|nr:CRTAC1 family protein [Spirosoma panaciterrae]